MIEGVAPPVEPPTLRITKNQNGSLTISWDANATFVLESKVQLSDATWSPVPGVTGNSVTITPSQATSFYRLRQ